VRSYFYESRLPVSPGLDIACFVVVETRETSMFMRVRRNRTAIHLRLFRALCQRDLFGFHRFFPVFLGFVRFWVHFGAFSVTKSAKKPLQSPRCEIIPTLTLDKDRAREQPADGDFFARFC